MQGVEIDQSYLDQMRTHGKHGESIGEHQLDNRQKDVQWKLFDRKNKETGLPNVSGTEVTMDHHVITEQTTGRDFDNPLNLVRL